MFNHFLITRFNLNKDDWSKDKSGIDVLDEGWLENRISLFLNFCLPSVVNQRSSEFKWMIFFESGTQWQIDKVLRKTAYYSFIEPVFVKGYKEFQSDLPLLLEQRMGTTCDWLITTRLDNDDAIHEDFILDVQNLAQKVDSDTLISFPFGLCLQFGKKKKLGLQYYPENQFLTFVEKLKKGRNPRSVYAHEHDNWTADIKRVSGGREPRWLQVVHKRNMVNAFRGTLVFSWHLSKFHAQKIVLPLTYNLKIAANKILKKMAKNLKLYFTGK